MFLPRIKFSAKGLYKNSSIYNPLLIIISFNLFLSDIGIYLSCSFKQYNSSVSPKNKYIVSLL